MLILSYRNIVTQHRNIVTKHPYERGGTDTIPSVYNFSSALSQSVSEQREYIESESQVSGKSRSVVVSRSGAEESISRE